MSQLMKRSINVLDLRPSNTNLNLNVSCFNKDKMRGIQSLYLNPESTRQNLLLFILN